MRLFSVVSLPDENGCMKCNLSDNGKGYRKLRVGGRKGKYVYTHRLMYEFLVGPIPDGLIIDHLCRNRWCAAPDHLEPVTYSENALRGDAGKHVKERAAKITHCPQNHPYSENNVKVYNGSRHCMTCIRNHTYTKRKKLAQPQL